MAPSKQKQLSAFFGVEKKRDIAKSCLQWRNKRPRQENGSNFASCPLCSRSFPLHKLETHASGCIGLPEVTPDKAVLSKEEEKERDQFRCTEPLPGLFLYHEFVSEAEERQILAALDGESSQFGKDSLPRVLANFNGPHLGKRWGVHCNLRDRRVTAPENPLPCFVRDLLAPKLKVLKPMNNFSLNEANAIDYRRRQGHFLAAHVDDRKLSKEPIANISLAGDCYMTFRNVASHRNTAAQAEKVFLPQRCLQILTGKARYDFSHAIDHKDLLSDRRVSVTMRESPLTQSSGGDLHNSLVWKPRQPRHPSWPALNWIEPTDEPIPGLFVFDEFISEHEEKLILNEMDIGADGQEWKYEAHTGSHREKRWGVDHDLWSRDVRPPKHELPNMIKTILIPKLNRIAAMSGCVPNDANAIDYRRKHGNALTSHVDDRKKHKEPIANLSLAGSCYMTFRNQNRERNLAVEERRVLLRPRTLQVLTGKARYDFSHGIANNDLLSDRRVSLTIRETPWKGRP
jgi:alkylated DNA repair protein alkB family protein 4